MPQDRLEKPTGDGTATHDEQKTASEGEARSTAATTPSITATSAANDDLNDAIAARLSQISTPPEKSPHQTPKGSLRVSKATTRPQLLSHTTTAVTRAEIHGASQAESSPSASTAASRAQSRRGSYSKGQAPNRQISRLHQEADDVASIKSSASHGGSMLGDNGAEGILSGLIGSDEAAEWTGQHTTGAEQQEPTEADVQKDQEFESQFASEFIEFDNLKTQGSNEEALMLAWSLKLKQFFILSSAGKPIWSRHGDNELISNSIGVIQTIISFYQEAKDTLKSFVAGDARFCILSKGHLHLVAVSRMAENDAQLRVQLEALYMQILSTLTLTNMEKIFQNRPSTDLRRPLQGTEKLLSALADGFTRGSPSTLLSALECLRLRKIHRAAINNHFSNSRAQSLLYGLLVTDTGQLVSVLRPKKQSLHPGDLQLIFNMLFEAKSIRTGGGESWIPLCLPGFNNTGYVYMYVSFLDIGTLGDPPPQHPSQPEPSAKGATGPTLTPAQTPGKAPPPQPQPREFCLVLISAHPNSFEDLRNMRNTFVSSVIGSSSSTSVSTTSGATTSSATNTPAPSLAPLRAALSSPRLPLTTIAPGAPLQHFLYKCRTHVQYVQPSATPHFETALAWRRLMNRYGALHAAVHGRGAGRNKVVHVVSRGGIGVAWCTAHFEIYAVAERGVSRAAMARGVEMVVSWARREEERCFVVGGAVF